MNAMICDDDEQKRGTTKAGNKYIDAYFFMSGSSHHESFGIVASFHKYKQNNVVNFANNHSEDSASFICE